MNKKLILTLLGIIVLIVMAIVTLKFSPNLGNGENVEQVFPKFDVSLTGTPTLNTPLNLMVEIASKKTINVDVEGFEEQIISLSNYPFKIKVFLPEGLESIQGDLEWEGTLDPQEDEILTLESEIQTVSFGDWVIEVITFYRDDDGFYTPLETRYLFITTNDLESVVSDTPLKTKEVYTFPVTSFN